MFTFKKLHDKLYFISKQHRCLHQQNDLHENGRSRSVQSSDTPISRTKSTLSWLSNHSKRHCQHLPSALLYKPLCGDSCTRRRALDFWHEKIINLLLKQCVVENDYIFAGKSLQNRCLKFLNFSESIFILLLVSVAAKVENFRICSSDSYIKFALKEVFGQILISPGQFSFARSNGPLDLGSLFLGQKRRDQMWVNPRC